MNLSCLRRGLPSGSAAIVYLILWAAVFWVSGPAVVIAQDAGSPVFAIIDVQRVLRESTAVKWLSRSIEEQKGEYQTGLRKEEDALRKADQELSRQRAVLSVEMYRQKRLELEKKVATLQREAQQRRRKLDQEFANGMSRIQNELEKVAVEIAEERGLDLVLSKATVVLVRPRFEITEEAVKRLNARLTQLPLPQQQN